jgi:glucose-1-phosphate thymidylyltransferase
MPPRDLVGLVPAAGRSTRIAPLPCSKELFPVGFRSVPGASGPEMRPKVVCHYLLEAMQRAGVGRAYLVLREGKWDIPAYLREGTLVGMRLAYVVTDSPHGPPYSLDAAYPFVRDSLVVFGFPDILLSPPELYVRLLERQTATGADAVLALFPAVDTGKVDMIDVEERGRVLGIRIQPERTELRHTWMSAVWTPAFTEFLHEHLARDARPDGRELSVGEVLGAAARHLHVDSVLFATGTYLDIGTPDGLVQAVLAFGAGGP